MMWTRRASSPKPPLRRLRNTLALGLACALAVGCAAEPAEVVLAARQALPSGTSAVLPWLAADARAVLAAEPTIRAASGKMWKVTPDGKLPAALLPPGEVVRTTVLGSRASVVVAKGRQQRAVPLVRERGQWRIDLLAMPAWWDHVRPK